MQFATFSRERVINMKECTYYETSIGRATKTLTK